MPPRLLRKSRFTEADLDLPEVQNFSCGPNRWDLGVAIWIQSRSGENSALQDIKDYRIEV